MKQFTIIGRWADNAQPFVAFVEADTVERAYQALKRKLVEDREAGQEVPEPDGLWILGAFEGHLMEIGGLSHETLLSEIEES